MIEIRELSKSYKNYRVLRNVNLQIKRNEMIAFTGKNGSGKTTLLKCICGLISPESGSITIDNKVMNNKNFNSHMKDFGAVFEGARSLYWRIRVKDNLYYFASLKGMKKEEVNHRIEELEKLDFFSIKPILYKNVKDLSLGQKQKVAIFIALIHNPKILILDEPFNGLDTSSKLELSTLLNTLRKKSDLTILFTSHIDNLLYDTTTKIISLEEGKLSEEVINVI